MVILQLYNSTEVLVTSHFTRLKWRDCNDLLHENGPVANDLSLTMLRAAANGNYVVPRTNRRLGDRAFSVAAPKAWNSLPTDLNIATCSSDAFKRRLNTWLLKRAYDWHTDYQCFMIIIIIIVIIILIIILSLPFYVMRLRSILVL